jgi:hypothetical protein
MEVRRHKLLLTINRNKLVTLTALCPLGVPDKLANKKKL